jgi:predicted PurR-regulated permease PerM
VISVGQLVALACTLIFAAIAFYIIKVLNRVNKNLIETQKLVAGITDKTVPLLGEVTTSVTHVNKELVRVDAITANVQSMTGNVSALTSLFAATLGSPVIKVAAFSYGVRRATHRRHSDEVEKRVRAELKSERKGRRR